MTPSATDALRRLAGELDAPGAEPAAVMRSYSNNAKDDQSDSARVSRVLEGMSEAVGEGRQVSRDAVLDAARLALESDPVPASNGASFRAWLDGEGGAASPALRALIDVEDRAAAMRSSGRPVPASRVAGLRLAAKEQGKGTLFAQSPAPAPNETIEAMLHSKNGLVERVRTATFDNHLQDTLRNTAAYADRVWLFDDKVSNPAVAEAKATAERKIARIAAATLDLHSDGPYAPLHEAFSGRGADGKPMLRFFRKEPSHLPEPLSNAGLTTADMRDFANRASHEYVALAELAVLSSDDAPRNAAEVPAWLASREVLPGRLGPLAKTALDWRDRTNARGTPIDPAVVLGRETSAEGPGRGNRRGRLTPEDYRDMFWEHRASAQQDARAYAEGLARRVVAGDEATITALLEIGGRRSDDEAAEKVQVDANLPLALVRHSAARAMASFADEVNGGQFDAQRRGLWVARFADEVRGHRLAGALDSKTQSSIGAIAARARLGLTGKSGQGDVVVALVDPRDAQGGPRLVTALAQAGLRLDGLEIHIPTRIDDSFRARPFTESLEKAPVLDRVQFREYRTSGMEPVARLVNGRSPALLDLSEELGALSRGDDQAPHRILGYVEALAEARFVLDRAEATSKFRDLVESPTKAAAFLVSEDATRRLHEPREDGSPDFRRPISPTKFGVAEALEMGEQALSDLRLRGLVRDGGEIGGALADAIMRRDADLFEKAAGQGGGVAVAAARRGEWSVAEGMAHEAFAAPNPFVRRLEALTAAGDADGVIDTLRAGSVAWSFGKLPEEMVRLHRVADAARDWIAKDAAVSGIEGSGIEVNQAREVARSERTAASAALENAVDGMAGRDQSPDSTRAQEMSKDALTRANGLVRQGKRVIVVDVSGDHDERGQRFRRRHAHADTLDDYSGTNLRAAFERMGVRYFDAFEGKKTASDHTSDTEGADAVEKKRADNVFEDKVTPQQAREEAMLAAKQSSHLAREVFHPARAFTVGDGENRRLNRLAEGILSHAPANPAAPTDIDLHTTQVAALIRGMEAARRAPRQDLGQGEIDHARSVVTARLDTPEGATGPLAAIRAEVVSRGFVPADEMRERLAGVVGKGGAKASEASDLFGYMRAVEAPRASFDPWQQGDTGLRVPSVSLAAAAVRAASSPMGEGEKDGLRSALAQAVKAEGPFGTKVLAAAEAIERERGNLPPDLAKVGSLAGDAVPVSLAGLGVAAADLSSTVRRADRERPVAEAISKARDERRLDRAFRAAAEMGKETRAPGVRRVADASEEALRVAGAFATALKATPDAGPFAALRGATDDPALMAARLSVADPSANRDGHPLAALHRDAAAASRSAREILVSYAVDRAPQTVVPAAARSLVTFEEVAPAVARTSMLTVQPDWRIGDALGSVKRDLADQQEASMLGRSKASVAVETVTPARAERKAEPLPRSSDEAHRSAFQRMPVTRWLRTDDAVGAAVLNGHARESADGMMAQAHSSGLVDAKSGEVGYVVRVEEMLDEASSRRGDAGMSDEQRERHTLVRMAQKNAADFLADRVPAPAPWTPVRGEGELRDTMAGRRADVQLVRGDERRQASVAVPADTRMPREEVISRAGVRAASEATKADAEAHGKRIERFRVEVVHVDPLHRSGAKVVTLSDGRSSIDMAVDARGRPLRQREDQNAFAVAAKANATSRTIAAPRSAQSPMREGSYTVEVKAKAYVDPSLTAAAKPATARQNTAAVVLA